MQTNYAVHIEKYAERHFLKTFEKKYKAHWDLTFRGIVAEFERIEALLETGKAETICDVDEIRIIKTKFRVFGTQESAKTSGNRCIVAQHKDKGVICILLVYTKTDLSGHNETAEWKTMVKENYPEYKHLF